MFTAKNYEYDCTRKCRLRAHGNAITSALTKRSMENEKLAAYVAKTCCNYADILDDLGRPAVHVAASVNRYEILEWLLNQGSVINGRDFESESSPLHRAIFYGCIDCAILLLRYGASLDILDADTRSPLQLVCRLGDYSSKNKVAANNELLVWGSNKNYNLGVNNDQGTDHFPQMLDYFRKEQISVQTVALGAYHSLFLDKKSNLYAVGHGKGGRLGSGNENSLSTPKKVKIPLKNNGEEIICISISRKHSLLLTNFSLVFACGLNESQQLGIREVGERCLNFKEVSTLRNFSVEGGLRKVLAKDCYSLAYSEKCVFVWGTNVGQMGMDANVKVVQLPKLMKLPQNAAIQFIEANNNATVVVTKDNTILLYHNYKMKTLKAPNYEALKSIAVVEGNNTNAEKGSASALKLLILTQTNVVFLWYQVTQNFYRCTFSNIRLIQIDKVLYKGNQLLILSQGDVYKGKSQQVSVPSCYSNAENANTSKSVANIWSRSDHRTAEMAKDFMIRIDLQRIIQIDRAVDVFCDDDFVSFAALQESHVKYFKLPALNAEGYTFKKLYNDVCEYDTIHDVVFRVDGDKFPAHRFIVYARVPGLREIMSKDEREIFLPYALLTGKMFELILKFVYTNYLPNEQDLEDMQSSLHTDSPAELEDVCNIFLQFVQQFHITNLANYLNYYLKEFPFYLPHMLDKSKYRFHRLRHTDHPQFYDVRILCENSEELPAHKCVLVSRLEYFEMMFTHTWAEQSTINLSTVPMEYMKAIVEFLYSLDVEHFRKQQYRETFLYNMIVFCDQFFIERLRKVCEILLLDKISIRKCGDMLEFACMYNCELMKKGCLDFICQNLARILLQKSLVNCEPEALKCINDHYRQMFKQVFDYRIITPDSEAIDDDCLSSFVEDFQVDLNYRMDEEEQILYRNLQKTKTKENKSKLSTRQYERDAITSMMETLNVAENSEKVHRISEKSQAVKEAEEVANKLQNEAKTWMKVCDKKDAKKRLSVEKIVKANDIINQEQPPLANYVVLSKTTHETSTAVQAKSPEKESVEQCATTSAPKLYNINLADLTTPPREKLSQKQRKRLSSESSNIVGSAGRAPSSQETTPVAKAHVPNAWGTTPQSPAIITEFEAINSPPTGSSADPSSFANMMRSTAKAATSSPANTTHANNSFSQILAEEKRQREYYERTKHKSLALTQIEEQAIAELKAFYNVQNVTDEIITIRRKSIQPTINFAVWQRN